MLATKARGRCHIRGGPTRWGSERWPRWRRRTGRVTRRTRMEEAAVRVKDHLRVARWWWSSSERRGRKVACLLDQ